MNTTIFLQWMSDTIMNGFTIDQDDKDCPHVNTDGQTIDHENVDDPSKLAIELGKDHKDHELKWETKTTLIVLKIRRRHIFRFILFLKF